MITMSLLAVLWMAVTLLVVTALSLLAKKLGPGVLIGVYCGLVIVSAVAATKLITIFVFTVPAGVIVYSASFLATDILSECYKDGRRYAITAVWTGFWMMLLYFLYAVVTVFWPPVDYWPNQEAYEAIVTPSWRIALAGAAAFLVSQFVDINIFHKLKSRHHRSKLVVRNLVSTSVGQSFDTLIFITIAFYGMFPLLPLIVGQLVVKVIIAFVDTPFVILARRILAPEKDIEGSGI